MGVNSVSFNSQIDRLGEPVLWFPAIKNNREDAQTNYINRGASLAEKAGYIYPSAGIALKALPGRTKTDNEVAPFGLIPAGTVTMTVRTDLCQPSQQDKFVKTNSQQTAIGPMTRATGTNFDTLPLLFVFRLLFIQAGTTVYIIGTDVVLSGNQLHWLTSHKPADGSVYSFRALYRPTYIYLGATQQETFIDDNGLPMPTRGIVRLDKPGEPNATP